MKKGKPEATRRDRRRERTRRALLDAATSLIGTRGLEATRVEDVTEAADLGKGAFYNYFESKEALYASLLSEAVDLLDRVFLEEVEAESTFEQRVRRLCRQHEAFFASHPVYLLLFHQARGLLLRGGEDNPQLAAILRDYLGRLARRLAAPGPATAETVDRAAALAGALAGYHSFRIAAGLEPTDGAVEALATAGLAGVGRPRSTAD